MPLPAKLILAFLAIYCLASCAFDVETKYGSIKSAGKTITVIQK